MVEAAWQTVGDIFDHFCLTAGIATREGMMEDDAERLCRPRYGRLKERDGHRWGRTTGRLAFHGGTIPVWRPLVRPRSGELALPRWEAARSDDWLGKVPGERLKKAGATIEVISLAAGEINGWDMNDWDRPVKVDQVARSSLIVGPRRHRAAGRADQS